MLRHREPAWGARQPMRSWRGGVDGVGGAGDKEGRTGTATGIGTGSAPLATGSRGK